MWENSMWTAVLINCYHHGWSMQFVHAWSLNNFQRTKRMRGGATDGQTDMHWWLTDSTGRRHPNESISLFRRRNMRRSIFKVQYIKNQNACCGQKLHGSHNSTIRIDLLFHYRTHIRSSGIRLSHIISKLSFKNLPHNGTRHFYFSMVCVWQA